MEPLITIGIATRNRPQFLRDAVESALNQDAPCAYEILVVDDASDDAAQKTYLDSLSNPKVRVVRREQQGGEAASRNTIIENMRGSYSLWLDDDDILTKDAVFSHAKALEKHANADVIYANLIRTDERLNPVKEYAYKEVQPELRLYVLLFYSPFPNGGSLIRRSLFDRCGRYDESFKVAPDYEFWVRAVMAGAEFVHNNHVIYHYRRHGKNAALDNEDAIFCEMNCRVVQKIISQVPLQQLFPVYNWKQEGERAFALSMASIAVVFSRYRNFQLAFDAIRQAEAKTKSPEIEAVKGILLRVLGKADLAAASLEKAMLGMNPALFNIFRMAGLK